MHERFYKIHLFKMYLFGCKSLHFEINNEIDIPDQRLNSATQIIFKHISTPNVRISQLTECRTNSVSSFHTWGKYPFRENLSEVFNFHIVLIVNLSRFQFSQGRSVVASFTSSDISSETSSFSVILIEFNEFKIWWCHWKKVTYI